jgi:hypothetical protein
MWNIDSPWRDALPASGDVSQRTLPRECGVHGVRGFHGPARLFYADGMPSVKQ